MSMANPTTIPDLAIQPSPASPTDMPTMKMFLNQSGTIRKFSPIQQDVDAVQFQGWSNASRIFGWIDGVMYVPKGFDHALRLPEEFDPNTRALHPEAPEFLSVKSGGQEFRVDLNFWLVRLASGEMHVYNNDMFASIFAESFDADRAYSNR